MDLYILKVGRSERKTSSPSIRSVLQQDGSSSPTQATASSVQHETSTSSQERAGSLYVMIPATALNGRHSASDLLFTEIRFLKGRDQGWHVPIFSVRHGAPSAGMVRASYLSPLLR